jgi:diaminohydroxyphosphoribosylaminopyrimidine deaminase/5-amino-6-(5-phosphoribosylamino)uracil reductase
VVAARPDPNPQSQGGSAQLEEAGVPFTWLPQCAAAVAVSEPFVHRSLTGLPWVVAKWAQTIDGRVATRSGASQWISSHLSRRLVHRERGRVDAIMTGIGTVLSDDPQLTARGVRRRRIARRVIIDPLLEIPIDAAVVRSAGDTPTTVACTTEAANDQADRATQLQAAGVQLVALPAEQGGLPLGLLLQQLSSAHDLSTVLVEAGPGLTSRLLSEGLVSEAWVFTAPLLLADDQAVPCVRGQISPDLADGMHLELIDQRRRGHDTVARYRVLPPERAP